VTEQTSPVSETDIVQRLRNFCVWNNRHSHYDPVPVCQEAAAEIERLRGLAQTPDYVRGLEDAALIVERWSLPTIQTPSMWLVDKAGIAFDIRALASPDTSTSQNTNRNWTEDAAHENGNYECRCVECGNSFIGHKRRVLCRLCSVLLSPSDTSPARKDAT
jgi:hypothetical protein